MLNFQFLEISTLGQYSGDLNKEHQNNRLLEVRYSDHPLFRCANRTSDLPGKKTSDKLSSFQITIMVNTYRYISQHIH